MIFNNIFKQYIKPLLMVGFLLVIWFSSDFLKKSYKVVPKILENSLPLKVNPLVSGGEIMVSYEDELGDTEFAAGIIPPKNPLFSDVDKALDISSLIIHEPYKTRNSTQVFNLDLEMVKLVSDPENLNGFAYIMGRIYLDINDGNITGSEKAISSGEKIAFQPGFVWDYLIEFDCMHKTGKLINAETAAEYPVQVKHNFQKKFYPSGSAGRRKV